MTNSSKMIEKETEPQTIEANALNVEDFTYDLPPELIAQEPLAVRHQSRLLHLDRQSGATNHLHFENIVDVLRGGDLIVVNNTKVIPARVLARRQSGGQIKLLLIKPDAANPGIWEALVTPIKRIKVGEELVAETAAEHSIKVIDLFTGPDGFKRLRVDLGERRHVFDLLSQIGQAPLPPYIHRDGANEREHDLDRYQTVYATSPGAVAAPTAGLHFSGETLARLTDKGIELAQVTLHVGPGTFKPIADSVENHVIESETFSISETTAQAVNEAKQDGRRVIAVGTTCVRALESAATAGRVTAVADGATSLYVKPGFPFQIVDGLVTNFHLSRSSLLVLVAAFAGRESILNAYAEAIEQRYRFFSYGDAMLIL
ncbi:MAG TPA: tRNA preQ1(34) S-adenosylmethionine ribosyltransferase-isomerase QueA [Trichormus sp.]